VSDVNAGTIMTLVVPLSLLIVVLGVAFLCLAALLWRNVSRRRASLLFHYSLLYLALLFVAMALSAIT